MAQKSQSGGNTSSCLDLYRTAACLSFTPVVDQASTFRLVLVFKNTSSRRPHGKKSTKVRISQNNFVTSSKSHYILLSDFSTYNLLPILFRSFFHTHNHYQLLLRTNLNPLKLSLAPNPVRDFATKPVPCTQEPNCQPHLSHPNPCQFLLPHISILSPSAMTSMWGQLRIVIYQNKCPNP